MPLLGDIAMIFIHFHTIFDHIWTNLLTQCTPVPVSVFCCFCISGFSITKTARKIPEKKIYKISVPEPSRTPKESRRGATRAPGALVARPPSWPRRGGAWAPQVSSDVTLWPIFNTRSRNPDWGPLFSRRNSDLRRHRHQASGDQNSCV